jgi:hypothetical protein
MINKNTDDSIISEVGLEHFYRNVVPQDSIINNKNNMENGIGKLDWANIKSALVYGLLWGVLAIVIYMIQIGDIYALNYRDLSNAGVYGVLGSLVSVLKNLLTTDKGNFVGAVKVIPEIE